MACCQWPAAHRCHRPHGLSCATTGRLCRRRRGRNACSCACRPDVKTVAARWVRSRPFVFQLYCFTASSASRSIFRPNLGLERQMRSETSDDPHSGLRAGHMRARVRPPTQNARRRAPRRIKANLCLSNFPASVLASPHGMASSRTRRASLSHRASCTIDPIRRHSRTLRMPSKCRSHASHVPLTYHPLCGQTLSPTSA